MPKYKFHFDMLSIKKQRWKHNFPRSKKMSKKIEKLIKVKSIMKVTIDSMRISIGEKKYELLFTDDLERTCSSCAFYDKNFRDINLTCPKLYECGNILYPCSCRESNFKGYWVEVQNE